MECVKQKSHETERQPITVPALTCTASSPEDKFLKRCKSSSLRVNMYLYLVVLSVDGMWPISRVAFKGKSTINMYKTVIQNYTHTV